MEPKIKYAFTSLLIIAIAVGLYAARVWNGETALFPHVVGYPALVLAIIILVIDIRNGRRQAKDHKAAGDDEFARVAFRTIRYFAWLVGFVVFVWAIGIVYTIPIYVLGYMKIEGKYSWLKSGIYAVATVAFIFVLFDYIFGVAWPEGVLVSMLRS